MVLDDDVLATLTGAASHLALVPVVLVVGAADRAGGSVVAVLGAVAGTDAGGRASVGGGHTASSHGTQLVSTRVLCIWREHITGLAQC